MPRYLWDIEEQREVWKTLDYEKQKLIWNAGAWTYTKGFTGEGKSPLSKEDAMYLVENIIEARDRDASRSVAPGEWPCRYTHENVLRIMGGQEPITTDLLRDFDIEEGQFSL
jgi:hypothetical protein